MHSPADGPLDPIEHMLLLDPFFGDGGGEESTVQHFLLQSAFSTALGYDILGLVETLAYLNILGIIRTEPRGRRATTAGGGYACACFPGSLYGARFTVLTAIRSRIGATGTCLGCRRWFTARFTARLFLCEAEAEWAP